MELKKSVLLAICTISISGCAMGSPAESANNCSIWEDDYFRFLPTSSQLTDPHGYFSEVVEEQNAFLKKLEALPATTAEENDLIRALLDGHRQLMSAYGDQLSMLSPGETREDFLRGLSDADFDAWVAEGEDLAAKTQAVTVAFERYSAFCSSED